MTARKPTAQKKLEGTYRDDRAVPNEPEVEAKCPTPPTYLDKFAREEWKRYAPLLASMEILAETDRDALASFCTAVAECRHCLAILKKEGRFYKSSTGLSKEHPASKALRDWKKDQRAWGALLGLSPSDRSGVSKILDPEEVDPLDELLAN